MSRRPVRVVLTGGEPLASPAFWDIAARVVKLGATARGPVDFAVLTSGQGIDASAATALATLGPAFVQISLDGGRDCHNALRGPGRFEAAIQAVECLARVKTRTLLAFTAHGGNFREIATVARLGRELKVNKVWADRFVPLAARQDHTAPLPLTPEQTKEFCNLLHAASTGKATGLAAVWNRLRAKHSARTLIAAERGLQFLVAGGRPYACDAGRRLIALLPDGNVLPCRRLPLVAGNLHQAPLHSIFAASPLLVSLRTRRHGVECSRCAYRTGCRGGSRCQAYARHATPFARDPGCWLAFAP